MPSFLIQLSVYVTNTFSPEVLILFCVFMLSLSVMYLNVKQIRYREVLSVNCPNNIKGVLVISLSVFLSGILSVMIKYMFKVLRPQDMLVLENGYSFPSAHTAMIFAFSFSAIFILFRYFKDRNHVLINYLHSTLFLSIAVLVGFTRLILQVHRPVDIFGGIALAAFCTFFSVKIYYTITKYVDFKVIK